VSVGKKKKKRKWKGLKREYISQIGQVNSVGDIVKMSMGTIQRLVLSELLIESSISKESEGMT
jgi:hypothetical protein